MMTRWTFHKYIASRNSYLIVVIDICSVNDSMLLPQYPGTQYNYLPKSLESISG